MLSQIPTLLPNSRHWTRCRPKPARGCSCFLEGLSVLGHFLWVLQPGGAPTRSFLHPGFRLAMASIPKVLVRSSTRSPRVWIYSKQHGFLILVTCLKFLSINPGYCYKLASGEQVAVIAASVFILATQRTQEQRGGGGKELESTASSSRFNK